MSMSAYTDACMLAGPVLTECKGQGGQSTGRSAVVSAVTGDLCSKVAQVTSFCLAEESERLQEHQGPELKSHACWCAPAGVNL